MPETSGRYHHAGAEAEGRGSAQTHKKGNTVPHATTQPEGQMLASKVVAIYSPPRRGNLRMLWMYALLNDIPSKCFAKDRKRACGVPKFTEPSAFLGMPEMSGLRADGGRPVPEDAGVQPQPGAIAPAGGKT